MFQQPESEQRRGTICKDKLKIKINKIQISCPRDTLELLPVGDALPPCQCALTDSRFSACSLRHS